MSEKYGERGLTVVGVHSPEFEQEKKPANVRDNVKELGVTYPVVLDNDFKMWDALDNRYWPSLYLVDRRGVIRRAHTGEIDEGSRDAKILEGVVTRLLAEPAEGKPPATAP
jgi:hypothetical protein